MVSGSLGGGVFNVFLSVDNVIFKVFNVVFKGLFLDVEDFLKISLGVADI